jgi:hypothetical protein
MTSAEPSAGASSGLEKAARAGYFAKGVVYVLIGIFAFRVAIGSAGASAREASSEGALREIATAPFGSVLLVLMALGLVGYSIWRFFEAIRDPEDRGTDAKGVVKRVALGVSGLVYLGLAVLAVSIVLGSSGGGASGDSSDAWTARLMDAPFGRWLVGALGAIVVAVGLYHFKRAAKDSFLEPLRPASLSPRARKWVVRVCRTGLVARGATFVVIGAFLVVAAIQHDPSEARGLSGALQTLYEQPFGAFLLGAVGLGLVAYGGYCFTNARYRRIPAH